MPFILYLWESQQGVPRSTAQIQHFHAWLSPLPASDDVIEKILWTNPVAKELVSPIFFKQLPNEFEHEEVRGEQCLTGKRKRSALFCQALPDALFFQ